MAFGVSKVGVIYGNRTSRREEDNLKCMVDEAIRRTIPCVRNDQYLVKFTRVNGEQSKGHAQQYARQVMEIKVAQGDPYELYEDQNHEVR